MAVAGSRTDFLHRRGKRALHRIRRRRRRAGRRSRGHEIGGDGTTQPTGEGARQHRAFRLETLERIRPRWMRLRFGTSEKGGSKRRRAGTERQGSRHAAPIADSTGGNNWRVDVIGKSWDQREEPPSLPFRGGLIE